MIWLIEYIDSVRHFLLDGNQRLEQFILVFVCLTIWLKIKWDLDMCKTEQIWLYVIKNLGISQQKFARDESVQWKLRESDKWITNGRIIRNIYQLYPHMIEAIFILEMAVSIDLLLLFNLLSCPMDAFLLWILLSELIFYVEESVWMNLPIRKLHWKSLRQSDRYLC